MRRHPAEFGLPDRPPEKWTGVTVAPIRSRSEAPWGPPRRSASPISPLLTTGGVNPQKGTHRLGGVVDPSHSGNLRPRLIRTATQICSGDLCHPRTEFGSDQASAVGVGTGSDCGGVTRERGRLHLAFVGFEAASFTISDFDRERVVRVGSGAASTSPSTCSAAVSAGLGASAATVFGLRPRPSCFASVDRRSE
jgi:hypothetical protein